MTDNEQSQLRFDISEKVIFHRDQSGIDTLLSLNLTPEVHIEDLGDNVQIQGAIRLSGTYLGQTTHTESLAEVSEWDGSQTEEEIEYVIPVEITLPSERASRLEEITAEIQSFDYDVLASHELGIEAVLVIDGLTLRNNSNVLNARFGEQEQQEEERKETEQASIKGHDDVTAPFGFRLDSAEERPSASVEEEFQAQPVDDRQKKAPDVGEAENDEPLQLSREEDEQASDEGGDSAATQEQEGFLKNSEGPVQTEEEVETKPHPSEHETKIHFYKKEETQTEDPLSLNDLLQDPSVPTHHTADIGESSASTPGVDHESSAAETRHSSEDGEQSTETVKNIGIEWMKQKLGGGEDRFHRLKMVIVQKDDTLEGIADRYELSAVELLQLNKLESGELEQGQIVYIPVRDH